MNPVFGIKIHRKRVAESVLKIRRQTNRNPVDILLSRCAIYEYFIDDAGLKKQFSKWIEKKKNSERDSFNGKHN
ncbi:hypothetical protein [Leptospira weilii]|uniref:hypothetical protein n=1 Tax=Leptospira weilii TaxID=28184 RepID=UPI0002E0378F|nr:hypothetical protein [Leptospira weilii]